MSSDSGILISFVIAAYNVEKYLCDCLDSIRDERFENIVEALVVNDGSTDRTREIAEEYVKWNPSIFRLINKQNGGLASVFNIGIREARGKYWISLDGDDTINREELFAFVDAIRDVDVDIIRFPKTIFDENREIIDEIKDPPFIHNFAVLSQILKEHVKIEEDYRLYADGPFVLYTIPYLKKSICLDMPIYRYRYSQEQSVSVKSLIKNKNDLFGTTWNMIEFYKQHREYLSVSETKSAWESLIQARIRTMYFIALFDKDTNLYEMNEKLKEDVPNLFDNAYFVVRVIRLNITPLNCLIKQFYKVMKCFIK